MCAAENMFKDITEISARLFDHRPALHGDINFFVKEFEEKSGDRDVKQLGSMHEQLTDITENQLPHCHDLGECNLSLIISKLTQAKDSINSILEKDGAVETEFLEGHRQDREQEWTEFMQRQYEKSADVDREYVQKLDELKEDYAGLEGKTNIGDTT